VNYDFAAILVGLTAITGIIAGLDRLFFAKARAERGALPGVEAKEPLLVEYARSFFPVILIVLLVRSFLAEPFRIPSSSMMPTLLIGDFILVNKFAYGIRLPVLDTKVVPIGEPARGDVVVFRYPGYSCPGREERSGARCEEPFMPVPRQDYIKRVVGLPGDEIVYRNHTLYVNGEVVAKDSLGRYIGSGSGRDMTGSELKLERLGEVEHQVLERPSTGFLPLGEGQFKVAEGHYFVMGDNRDNSEDSRFWGLVPETKLVGKAFLVWMNWDSKNGGIDFERLGTVIH
jgi:signal peptidase I